MMSFGANNTVDVATILVFAIFYNSNSLVLADRDSSSNLNLRGNAESISISGFSSDSSSSHADQKMIQLDVCGDKCGGQNCKTYKTPLQECFNGLNLFGPDDETWGESDVYDVYHERRNSITRYFFEDSSDGTCGGHTTTNSDSGEVDVDLSKASFSNHIPLEKCVGPFGQPRPWGEFTLYDESQTTVTSKKLEEPVLISRKKKGEKSPDFFDVIYL